MKAMPKIQKVMTPMPHSINADQPVKKALEMMREYRVRHLPVQTEGRLVGILSEGDIRLAASFRHSEEFKVEDIMTPEPYTVHPDTDLDTTVAEMAERKYGCVVVKQGNGKIVGIFTANDGLQALAHELNEHYRKEHA